MKFQTHRHTHIYIYKVYIYIKISQDSKRKSGLVSVQLKRLFAGIFPRTAAAFQNSSIVPSRGRESSYPGPLAFSKDMTGAVPPSSGVVFWMIWMYIEDHRTVKGAEEDWLKSLWKLPDSSQRSFVPISKKLTAALTNALWAWLMTHDAFKREAKLYYVVLFFRRPSTACTRCTMLHFAKALVLWQELVRAIFMKLWFNHAESFSYEAWMIFGRVASEEHTWSRRVLLAIRELPRGLSVPPVQSYLNNSYPQHPSNT